VVLPGSGKKKDMEFWGGSQKSSAMEGSAILKKSNNYNNNIYLTAVGLSPGGSGF
jgi:hypothetical protein